MRISIISLVVLLFAFKMADVNAQAISASSNLVAQPISDRSVFYNLSDTGVSKPIIWGLDLAWLDEGNIRRGITFMGKDVVDVIRSSFVTSNTLKGDTALQGEALTNTNLRVNIIKNNLGAGTKVVLNCDHPSVNDYYIGNASNWARLIDVTTKLHEDAGLDVISVSPFNEPDYGWEQYTGDGKLDFYNICGELRNNTRFNNVRICGGNTLNCDEALPWYNYLKGRLDEGNTHQLAGGFDSYANFFKTVRANGHHATADELHNVMEAMVGVEYGMQTGIWWGTAELARGEFCKASDGKRLGYAEHRTNWTAASVYRGPLGKIQAFGGTSERQAATTTYRFVSKERNVFYDGHGPQREYVIELPGGEVGSYQNGQTNAECVVNITWGDDIQPVVNGSYVLVNRNSGKVMEVSAGSVTNGANIRQNTYRDRTYQQWNVIPVGARIGGDFSYFKLSAVHSGKAPDVYNWSLDNGGNIAQWEIGENGPGGNQQWYLEYAEDGWFYIRSRHSALCLEVANASISDLANIQQWEKDGGTNQQWRFIPVDATVEFESPSAPVNVVGTENEESIRLDWTANSEEDVVGYTIFRSESEGGPYNTIARNVTTTSFVDNTTTISGQYYYTIKAIDYSLNSSEYSVEVSATATGNNSLVAQYKFNSNLMDNSKNLNHCASQGTFYYVNDNFGSKAIKLNGSNTYLQLPSDAVNQEEITITTWVLYRGTSSWQRIFDFGNGEDEYMFLTPSASSGNLRFAIKNGGDEQFLEASTSIAGYWNHVAVTLSSSKTCIYVNGELVAESDRIDISPIDFKPVLNYIGRSQFVADPLLNAYIDDFRIYNYALSANEVSDIASDQSTNVHDENSVLESNILIWPTPADDNVNVKYISRMKNSSVCAELFEMNGRLVLSKHGASVEEMQLNVSDFSSGIYILKLTNGNDTIMKKIVVRN